MALLTLNLNSSTGGCAKGNLVNAEYSLPLDDLSKYPSTSPYFVDTLGEPPVLFAIFTKHKASSTAITFSEVIMELHSRSLQEILLNR